MLNLSPLGARGANDAGRDDASGLADDIGLLQGVFDEYLLVRMPP